MVVVVVVVVLVVEEEGFEVEDGGIGGMEVVDAALVLERLRKRVIVEGLGRAVGQRKGRVRESGFEEDMVAIEVVVSCAVLQNRYKLMQVDLGSFQRY